jgi:succinyl-CoA:acetate CoA-transferase
MDTPITDRVNGSLPHYDADEAAAEIPADATLVVSGFGSVGYPKAVPLALADREDDLSLTVVSGGSVGGEIDDALVAADAIDRRYPFQAQPRIRDAINGGAIAFNDRHISSLGTEVLQRHLGDADVAVVEAVAVGEDWLVPSTSIGQTPAYVESADRLVVEVNEAQPLALQQVHDVYRPDRQPPRSPIPLSSVGERIGSPAIRFDPSKLVGVVRTDSRDSPYSFRTPTAVDEVIADNLASFLADEVERSPAFADAVRLQFGVGSLGNALMGELEAVDLGDRDLVYYGEVIQDGLLDLVDAGQLRAASATSLAFSEAGQTRFFDDLDRYADSFVFRPADISNCPEMIERFGVVAVNSALSVDLYGHVNSTHIDGRRVVTGIGGSGDFTRNALVSVMALPSTAGDGDISRIVPMVKHVDHTEHDLDVVVTEHGVADLRGTSPVERASALVEHCADPRFRDDLRSYLDRAREQGGHVPHDLETVFDWCDRT